MKNKPRLTFTVHALEQFRERWPECAHMERSTICNVLEKQILEADKNDDLAICEGGTYYPITFLGQDGYAVVHNASKVITILPEEYCKQVTSVRNQKSRGVSNVQHPARKDDLDRPPGSDGGSK